MVREGEEDTKKRGWFSRRKKKSATPAARVSRPPSTTSLSFEKKPRSSQSSVVDDQLPPREATSSPIPSVASRPATPGLEPSPATPLPAAAPEDGDVSAAVLPVHAGFNFEAMKEIIGKAEANPAELQVPAPSRFSAQQLHQPTNRSESVPLPSPDSPGATPRFRSSLDARPLAEEEEPVAGPSFYSSMSRSRSVNQIRNEDEDSLTPRFASMSLQSRDTLFSALPASFGSDDDSIWPSTERASTPTYRSPFMQDALRSHDKLSFGPRTESSLAPTSFATYGSLSGPSNPFGSPVVETPLTFGGVDGSITLSPSPLSVERDPWSSSVRTFSGEGAKKSASVLDLNPWQS